MCFLKDMSVFYLILLVELSSCIDMSGEVGFRLDLPGGKDGSPLQEFPDRKGADLEELVLEMHPIIGSVRRRRASSSAENEKAMSHSSLCTYKYPEIKQVDALLSNMMNELTKIFVRAREVLELDGAATVRAATRERKRKDKRSKLSSRFHVVSSKNSAYFDVIYSNMTKEYRKVYAEATHGTAALRSNDPCKNQAKIKEMWQELLDSSLTTLKKASLRCVKLYLRTVGRSQDSKAKNKLGMFLLKEFRRLRVYQLDTLCDLFRMCYKELLEDKVKVTFKKGHSY